MKDEIQISQLILEWYQKHQRELPWRNTKEPYKVWLSEIILQQTRVKQGLPYYERFLEAFPTVFDLARASEESVLRLWQGLGYYSRARNLHQTAKWIAEENQGVFPNTYRELLKLKGVGDYTAAAIASFAFDEDVAVLDGNVFRVWARYFGIHTAINSSKGKKEFFKVAQKMLFKGKAAEYNQAIMEFGAIQCSFPKPNCLFCPLQSGCYAFENNLQSELPVKEKKTKVRERYFYYLIFQKEDRLALKQRDTSDIWGGLYDFYLIDKPENLKKTELLNEIQELFPTNDMIVLKESKIFKHLLSHQRIFAQFLWIEVDRIEIKNQKFFKSQNFNFFTSEEVQQLPKPILIHNYLQKDWK